MGSVGSVLFQIVPCSSLYYFSRSVGPVQCLINANYRVLICSTCYFQNGSLFFVYFGILCLQVSSVFNFHSATRRQRWSLFRFTCSVVLWGGRNTANKYHWHVWGVLAVWATLDLSPLMACAFLVYTAQSPGCSTGELSKMGPGLRVLPRLKLLRFRFLGTP